MSRPGALAIAVMLVASAHDGGADEGATLVVKVTNLRSERGQVIACLYRSDDGFPKDERKAWRHESARISGGAAEVRFVGVPAGVYAVLTYHDENGNGVLERSFLGFPKEGGAHDGATRATGQRQ
jgi:uncharacterized protein (DUF2141 family)